MPTFTKQNNENNLFLSHFKNMTDPRRTNKGNHLYPLDEILFLVISAVISGVEGWESICEFGEIKIKWLRKYFPYVHGVPSHDVLSKLFARLNPKSFNQCFIDWINSVSNISDGEVVAIDGKTIRGSNYKNSSKSPYHVVSAYASDNRVCLGQETVQEKQNEIVAIPKLLKLIAIKGCIITIDAMGCQREIAKTIIDEKADYILRVKGNQETLQTEISNSFDKKVIASKNELLDAGHGRVETRICEVISDLELLNTKEKWQNVKSIIRVQSERTIKSTDKTTYNTKYYISSLDFSAERFNEAIRKHWSIENNLHWSLDVIFKEDGSLKKKDNSPVNFNIVRKVALSLLEKDTTIKKSKNVKRLKASLDDKYRAKLLNL